MYKKKELKRILELKNTITELKKKLLGSFNSRLRQAEKRTNELENRSFKIIESEK